MNRRIFVERVGRASLGLAMAPSLGVLGCGTSAPAGRGKHWAWVHAGGERPRDEWQDQFAKARDVGIQALLVSGGETSVLAEAAHEEGLEFHRWIWTLNRSGDPWVKEHHPEWFTVSRNGVSTLERPPYVGYYQWLCPTREPVRQYLRNVVDAVAAEPGVDGVHLDYVRHSDVILPVGLWSKYGLVQDREHPEFDFCYCDVCREAFRTQSGRDPAGLSDPTEDEEWRRFRWNSVTGLVRVLAEAAHAQRVPISAAVFPTPTVARRLVRQAWDEWPLDAVFPMLYHTFYEEPVEWISSATREGVEALPRQRSLYAGLFLPSLSPEELAVAVQHARDSGAAGVSLFALDGLTDHHASAVSPALRGWPWRDARVPSAPRSDSSRERVLRGAVPA